MEITFSYDDTPARHLPNETRKVLKAEPEWGLEHIQLAEI